MTIDSLDARTRGRTQAAVHSDGQPPYSAQWSTADAAQSDKTSRVRKRQYALSIFVTRFSMAITLVAWLGFVVVQILTLIGPVQRGEALRTAQLLLFTAIVSFLMYGNIVYFLTRAGYLARREAHRAVDFKNMRLPSAERAPVLTIVIPSYKEEIGVVRKTLLSAALQVYPNLNIALLIDNPPQPQKPDDLAALDEARRLVLELGDTFQQHAKLVAAGYDQFKHRASTGQLDIVAETKLISRFVWSTVAFYRELAADTPSNNHEDAFFHERILQQPMNDLVRLGYRLRQTPLDSAAEIHHLYSRLNALFSVQLTSFERKQFVNLSHEPNKAMNINSYLGLLGERWQTVRRSDGIHLLPADGEHFHLDVPASDYVISLDADSLLLSNYAVQLIHFMEQPENARIAVTQTPYTTFPNAPTSLERTAAATTDIQYIIHQGFTRFAATYWVGANALIRVKALSDIMSVELERGFIIKKFIQDRTVIEDTESSIDLIAHGWQLHNYPERLAFSATPPDFGSLIIQRRRWANGGLIILPKLLRYLVFGPGRRGKLLQGFTRIHYLASITGANIAMLLLMFFPFDNDSSILWVVAGSLPYFVLYARDLRLSGYRHRDILRVYALNLMLIPVNLSGVFKSIEQVATGRATPFKRTPKVVGRVATPASFVLAVWGLALFCVAVSVFDFLDANWLHGSFSLLNALGFLYASFVFIGVRDGVADLRLAS